MQRILPPDELASIREGVKLDALMPYVADEVSKMERALENRVQSELQAGTLTPEKALQAWIEKLSYRKLLSKFTQKVSIGQSMGQKHQSSLEKGSFNTYT
jgi:hypothetical protein